MAAEGVPFEDVMKERFGDPFGRVTTQTTGGVGA
jgi:hypothetical protein